MDHLYIYMLHIYCILYILYYIAGICSIYVRCFWNIFKNKHKPMYFDFTGKRLRFIHGNPFSQWQFVCSRRNAAHDVIYRVYAHIVYILYHIYYMGNEWKLIFSIYFLYFSKRFNTPDIYWWFHPTSSSKLRKT